MAIHWQVKFHSLRADTQYTVNIYDSTYTGNNPIQLKGGAQPFVTQEDADSDPFRPIRKQSGTLRIVDDGLDANGNAWDWRTIVPMTDTARPVTLTNSSGDTLWQGFMQAQNYGGVLYGNPQEREFPVQCCLSVLGAIEVDYQQSAIRNFAYLLNYILGSIPTISITSIVVQGNTDAQQWLLKKFDWNNFVEEDDDGVFSGRYKLDQVLEDMCAFWGWTARTWQKTLYLTCADDAAETSFLTLTRQQLETMATNGTAAGTTGGSFTTIPLTGDIFASTSNDDFQQRGPSKVTVKADVNANDRVVKVFPVSVEKSLDADGWHWVQTQGEDMVGYFETGMIYNFDTPILKGYNYQSFGAFSMRQIYSTSEADNATQADMILVNHIYDGNPCVSIETKKPMSFSGGSLKMSGTIYKGSEQCKVTKACWLFMRIGIGMSRASARWWYMDVNWNVGDSSITSGWGPAGTVKEFKAGIVGGSLTGTAFLQRGQWSGSAFTFRMTNYDIPCPGDANANMYGYLYVDILGMAEDDYATFDYWQTFQIANFAITFSRDSVAIPTSTSVVRARELTKERVTSKEYKSTNDVGTGMEWNADCIYASDNNMKYGYGLLMNADGTFLEKVAYNGTNEHPEQHLANRVATYWQQSKRMVSPDLRYDTTVPITGGSFALKSLTPQHKVTMDGTTLYPIAFSNNWWDDTMKLTLLQM